MIEQSISAASPPQRPATETSLENLVEPEKADSIPRNASLSDDIEQQPIQRLYVTGDRVNLRDGPGVQNKVVGQVTVGEAIESVLFENGWHRLRLRNGDTAWIIDTYVSVSPPVRKPAGQRSVAAPTSKEIADARREIIRQSIAAYPGSCPCPYNSDRAGRRCGGRSAWSKPGGYKPVCYDSDVTQSRLDTHLARLRGAVN